MDANFTTVAWAQNATIYEVNIRQYTPEGNFKAFQNHLPRLKDMGVDILWLMPITPISEKLKKGTLGSYYACSSYTKINTEFGTETDFLNLVNAAHDLGMKVIIDWVANHTGCKHDWMDNHPEWFTRNEAGVFTERNGWDDVVDLNYDNHEMRAALIAAMQYWVSNFKIDGFRCDMAHLVPLDFWIQARTALEKVKLLYWLAECEEVNYHQVFDTSYAWAFMHASEKLAKQQIGVNEVYNVLHGYAQYPKGASKLLFTSNHDENSWNGTEYEKYGVAAKAWAVFTQTWKGVPLIYSGQELPNKKRLAFFDKDQIEWAGWSDTNGVALHSFYKTLNEFRKSHTAITKGETFNLPVTENGVMAYLRYDEVSVVLVVLNLSAQHHRIQLSHEKLIGNFTNVFSGFSFPFANNVPFELMPGDYFVYVKILV
jgi:glycosidase